MICGITADILNTRDSNIAGRLFEMRCKDCEKWYGAEDDGFGPCSIKNARGDAKYITFGMHRCDEIYKDLDDEDDSARRKSDTACSG